MLELDNLDVGYGSSIILRDVRLKVEPGQVVCLIGRNGVGKTTLIKSVMGLLKPRKGEVRYNGERLNGTSPGYRAKRGIGYVPQGREIFAQLSVRENLWLGLEASRDKLKQVPEEALAQFPMLETMMDRKGGDLSGGQQQQLAFARALTASPDLLLLDEPTEGIQPSIVDQIHDVIRKIGSDRKTGILLVEQNVEFVRSVANYYYVMNKGAIVQEGDVSTLDEGVVDSHLVV